MKRLLYLCVVLAACNDERDAITGTQSIEVELLTPTNPGTVNQRLPDAAMHLITVNLTARDADGNVDTSFEEPVRVYAQFLGTLTPSLEQMALTTITMQDGVAMNRQITLPGSVLGPTVLWFDNGTGLGADYVHGKITGNSDTLWFRDPFIRDLQTPRDEMAIDALTKTALTDKQISVEASRHGANGRLVVTSTFAQGYTVSDVLCPNGQPPCTAGDYDHAMIFTFSAPRDQYFRRLEVGRAISRFTGGLSEFNGLTEVGFPRTYAPEDADTRPVINTALLPAPVELDAETTTDADTWFDALSTGNGVINFERNEAGAISVRGAKVCPTDEDYEMYKQWKLDPSPGVAGEADCTGNKLINVITQGTDFTTDPTTLVGRTLTRIVGIVRPVNIGSFNVWIIYPRGASDVTL